MYYQFIAPISYTVYDNYYIHGSRNDVTNAASIKIKFYDLITLIFSITSNGRDQHFS